MPPLKDRIYGFLRWSERYTRTDMVYLFHGGFWLTAAQIVTSLSSLGLSIAFANLIDPNTYGIYRYVIATAGIVAICTLPGLSTAVVRAVSQGKEGVLQTSVQTKMIWGVLGGAMALTLAAYYHFFGGNAQLSVCFLIASFFLPFMDAFGLYDAFLQGKRDFRTSALYMTAAQVFAAIAIAIAIMLTHNLYVMVFSYFAGWTVARYLQLKLTLRRYHPVSVRDSETTRYGMHLTFMSALGMAANYLDKLLIFHFLGATELAIYSIALAPVDQLKSLFKNIPVLALPILSRRTIKDIDSQLYLRVFQLVAIGIAFGLAYAVCVPLVFPVLFPRYLSAIPYSQWYMAAVAFVPAVSFFSTVFVSKPVLLKKNYLMTVIGNVTLIMGMLILGYLYGIAGIIAARILQSALGLPMLIALWQHEKRAF